MKADAEAAKNTKIAKKDKENLRKEIAGIPEEDDLPFPLVIIDTPPKTPTPPSPSLSSESAFDDDFFPEEPDPNRKQFKGDAKEALEKAKQLEEERAKNAA